MVDIGVIGSFSVMIENGGMRIRKEWIDRWIRCGRLLLMSGIWRIWGIGGI